MQEKKIYTNTVAQIGGKIVTAVISIYLITILTNYLGAAGFWWYSKIYNYLSIFAVIADLGLYAMSVRELSKYHDNPQQQAEISGNILSLRTISGIIIIFLSLFIAVFLPGYNDFIGLASIFIVALFTLFWLINSSIMSYLQAIYKAEFSFVAITSGKIFTFFLIFFAAKALPDLPMNEKILWIFSAWLFWNILMTILTWWYARKFQRIYFAWDTIFIKKILKISLPYGFALFLGVIFFKVDILLLSIMSPENLADKIVALYSLPMKIIDVGMMYGTIFLNSFLPMLTQAIEKKNQADTKRLAKKWFEILMGFGAAISVFLAVFSNEITRFIARDAFAETTIFWSRASDVLQIISWIFLFYFLSSLSNYILIAKNEQKKIIYVNLFIALFNIIGNILVIPTYSFIWSAIITLISQILLVIICGFLVRKELSPRLSSIYAIFFTIFSIVSVIISLFFEQLLKNFLQYSSIFITLCVAGSVFLLLYMFFWYGFKKLFINKQTIFDK